MIDHNASYWIDLLPTNQLIAGQGFEYIPSQTHRRYIHLGTLQAPQILRSSRAPHFDLKQNVSCAQIRALKWNKHILLRDPEWYELQKFHVHWNTRSPADFQNQ